MKKLFLLPLLLAGTAAWAQGGVVYRCGNTYTNNAEEARADKSCKVVEGGNVTVIHEPPRRTSGAGKRGSGATSPPNAPKVSSNTQQTRDREARQILTTELAGVRRALDRLREEYNGGEPTKSALELRNPQHYMERVDQLRADIARHESDMASIERELSRLP